MQNRLDPKALYHISTKKAPFAVGRPLPGGRFLVYTFDALADEMVRKAAPAVEALG